MFDFQFFANPNKLLLSYAQPTIMHCMKLDDWVNDLVRNPLLPGPYVPIYQRDCDGNLIPASQPVVTGLHFDGTHYWVCQLDLGDALKKCQYCTAPDAHTPRVGPRFVGVILP